MNKWPHWMDDHLKAKSADENGYQITLAEHTRDVLQRLGDQYRLRHILLGFNSTWWTVLYWACFLHDFGKAAQGFQEVLVLERGATNTWRERSHRHEVLSLGFVDWLFPKGHPLRYPVIGAIVSHHKDAELIFDLYGGRRPLRDEQPDLAQLYRENIEDLAAHIDQTERDLLWRWLDECALAWAQELGIPLQDKPDLLPLAKAHQTDLARAIFNALRDYARWQKDLPSQQRAAFEAILQRGLILTADHSASAGAGRFPDLDFDMGRAMKPLEDKGYRPRHHQEAAQAAPTGSAIMIAPTGSGKTEAALLWAARQMAHRPACRIFYTLPYQASMNAMAERIAARYFGETLRDSHNVNILHSRAMLKFYQDMMDAQDNPQAAKAAAKWRKNKSRLNYYPIQVLSPYQMLKAAFSLRGYEPLVVDYTDALFIFDEIHAYDAKRMALIIEMIGWLAANFGARFLIMTATLPPMIRDRLQTVLPGAHTIAVKDQVFRDAQRHTVHLLDGDLLTNAAAAIADDIAHNRAVLLCCNQVATAQQVYEQVEEAYGDILTPFEAGGDSQAGNLLMLHGRYNGRDRGAIEARLLEAVRAGERQPHHAPFVVIATQAVEVSLDVDFDTLYTEPAPLEAMLQRFGRVNRGRTTRELQPVHVYTAPSDPRDTEDVEKRYLPYQASLVQRSIEVLAAHCGGGRPIDEKQVTAMLGEIYTGPALDEWEATYDETARQFRKDILGWMRPYQSADYAIQSNFNKLFDGTQVLPLDLLDAYQDAAEQESYLAASQYLVNISWQQYHILANDGYVTPATRLEGDYVDQIHVPYDSRFGLLLDEARRQQREE